MFGNYSTQIDAFCLMVLADLWLAYEVLKEKEVEKKKRKKLFWIFFCGSIGVSLVWIGIVTVKLAISLYGILLLAFSLYLFIKMETDIKNYPDSIVIFGILFALCNGTVLAIIAIWIIEKFL